MCAWRQKREGSRVPVRCRPTWLEGQEKARGGGRPHSVSRTGEWKLVWKPGFDAGPSRTKTPKPLLAVGVRRNWGPGSDLHRSTAAELRASCRDAHRPPFPDCMTGILANGTRTLGLPGLVPRDMCPATRVRPASVMGSERPGSHISEVLTIGTARSTGSQKGPVQKLRLPSRRASEAATSTRSRQSTVSQHSLRSESACGTRRLGTALSTRSESSVDSRASSYSAYSGLTSVSQQDEILDRIKGLEEALNAERTLRMRMQEMIETKLPPTIPEG